MEVLLTQPSRTSERHRGLEKQLRQEIEAAQSADTTARWQAGQDALNIIYIMRNLVPVDSGPLSGLHGNGCGFGLALAFLLAPLARMRSQHEQDRIDLTGPWAGFGFQAGHMFTPDGHQLEPCDMAWWSLTSVIYLAEALRIRRERRFGVRDPGPNTEGSNVVYMSRGPRPRQRM